MNMRILYDQGRIVAINKSGKWEPLNGVSQYEVGQAIRNGEVEDYINEEEVTTADIVDFALTIAVCLTVLIVGMFILNIE
jgi:hypothetical protein